MTHEPAPRYAIYYVPSPASALGQLGCAILGYDADSGADMPFADPCGMSESAWREATREPRRYGFHATLKAPFRLRDGVSEDQLLAAARGFAEGRTVIDPVATHVTASSRFVTLVPMGQAPAIDRLAWDVVVALDQWRAPLTEDERARRLAVVLSPRQRAMLEAYGYPYVGEDFQFHMTLAGPLPAAALPDVRRRLAALLATIARDVTVDAIAVLRQDRADARFVVIRRYSFGAPLGPTGSR
jgi:hypothetical protein